MAFCGLDLLSESQKQEMQRKLRIVEERKPRQCEHIKSNGAFCGSPALRGRNYCYFHLTQIGRRLRAERAYAYPDNSGLSGSLTAQQFDGPGEALPTHSNRTNEWGTRASDDGSPIHSNGTNEYGTCGSRDSSPTHANGTNAWGPQPGPVLELPTLEDAGSIQIALMQVIDAILNGRLDNKRAGLVLYALQTASSNLKNGAEFHAPAESAVVGGYEEFEADYELGEDVPELRVAEEEVAEAEAAPPEAAAVTTKQGDASTAPEGQLVNVDSRPEDDAEDVREISFCDMSTRVCCSLFGPLATGFSLEQSGGVRREALRQRITWQRLRDDKAAVEGQPDPAKQAEEVAA